MRRTVCLALAAAALMGAASPALAQPAGKPPAAKATKDPSTSPAGTYALDARHVSVLLRVAHGGGFSYSVFRMDDVSGVLSWDPAKLEDSKVNVKIGAKSLQSNVPGFADQLTGPNFLNAAAFPEATFVSQSVKRTGPTTGEISGAFTLHGRHHPPHSGGRSGRRGRGHARSGPGLPRPWRVPPPGLRVGPVSPVIGDEVEVVIDVEFNKTS